MKFRQQNVCQTCRTHKIGCDGKRPECGQCMLRSRKCQWDVAGFTFVSQNRPISFSHGSPVARPFDQFLPLSRLAKNTQDDSDHSIRTAHEQFTFADELCCNGHIERIVSAFIPQEERPCDLEGLNDVPRICGAWVGVLPQLVRTTQTRDRVLSLAIAAFSSCLRLKPDASGIQIYNTAVEAVRDKLSTQERELNAALIAAVMCLTLTELFLPESSFGLAMHVHGVAQCFQAAGPDPFRSGVLYSLFAGFRPLLLLQGIQLRKSTFIASREWIDIPFFTHRPSLMQRLISYVAPLPSLLQQSDLSLASPCETNLDQARTLYNAYIELLSGMEIWEGSLRSDSPGSIWDCSPLRIHGISDSLENKLWFSDITMANVYTHMWAFRIICATEIRSLSRSFPSTCLQESSASGYVVSRDVQENNENLAELICCSMDYLLQDDLRLFGSTSAMLPLHVAYKVLMWNEPKNRLYLLYIRSVVDQMVERGIQCAPGQIYS